MLDKIIFLIQVYFALSFICTFILICNRLPYEIRLLKQNKIKRTYKDNLAFIKNIVIMLVGFPVIAFYYGLKEF